MSRLVRLAASQIKTAVEAAYAAAVSGGVLPAAETSPFKVEVPANRDNGDFSTNAAMAWAGALRLPPRKIAEALLAGIRLEGTLFERCEAAGPGFINFTLGERFYSGVLLEIAERGADYGRSDDGKGEKVNVEFVSANPTGPMHMGNARGGALGDCLAAVLDFAGYRVTREFYVNDAGNQMDKFALSLDIRYRQVCGDPDAPDLPEDSYHGEDITERARQFAEIHGGAYLSKSEEERRKALVDFALPKNIEEIRRILGIYRIGYDVWFYESTLHSNGELAETLRLLKERGHTYESGGALWYKNKEQLTKQLLAAGKTDAEIEKLELKDEVLVRANGHPTYFAADIAYHLNKIRVRGFDRCIDVWGADHHGHVARLKGALDAAGEDGSKLDIILMQLVRLTRNGEAVRMSKRTGKAITLGDLLEEIPVDAVRFLFNMREPASQMEFDLGLAVENSAKNPVYYCQYAHARICSILKKIRADGIEPAACGHGELRLLSTREERDLIRHLGSLTDEIAAAARTCDPARITRFLTELATLFHKFYTERRVACDDEALMQARLFLCRCVRDTMKNVMALMKITAPETM